MTYIENIFLCMVSPLLVAALCMGRRQLRFFLFCIAGMGVCLLSAYINTFLAAVCQADALAATAEIAPVVEEMMKLLPLVFYLLVFEPEGDKIKAAAITIALAFATFENVCYLIQNGADRFPFTQKDFLQSSGSYSFSGNQLQSVHLLQVLKQLIQAH